MCSENASSASRTLSLSALCCHIRSALLARHRARCLVVVCTGDAGTKLSQYLTIRRCAIRCALCAAQPVAACKLHLTAVPGSVDIEFVCNASGISSMSAALTRATSMAVSGSFLVFIRYVSVFRLHHEQLDTAVQIRQNRRQRQRAGA